MDWFEQLTGFVEEDYQTTRSLLRVEGQCLRSLVNSRVFGIGELQTPSLGELRASVSAGRAPKGQLKISNVVGNVRELHRDPHYQGALFQVASQFNLLEMVSPSVTPEQGVTRYQHDNTQGPACAIAAGAATIYRNYFVSVRGVHGQTAERQLDTLADLGAALSQCLECRVDDLYRMQNGYALPTREGLRAIREHICTCSAEEVDQLRSQLRIGLHTDVEVTDSTSDPRPRVSQAFCSALPVAYSSLEADLWHPFARLVLEAAYEATLLAGTLNLNRGGSNVVLLTCLGGGAFGNDVKWIDEAMDRAFQTVGDVDLDVRLVRRA